MFIRAEDQFVDILYRNAVVHHIFATPPFSYLQLKYKFDFVKIQAIHCKIYIKQKRLKLDEMMGLKRGGMRGIISQNLQV